MPSASQTKPAEVLIFLEIASGLRWAHLQASAVFVPARAQAFPLWSDGVRTRYDKGRAKPFSYAIL
jgi:hypothetical protein